MVTDSTCSSVDARNATRHMRSYIYSVLSASTASSQASQPDLTLILSICSCITSLLSEACSIPQALTSLEAAEGDQGDDRFLCMRDMDMSRHV